MLKNYKTEPCPRWFSAESNRICRLGAMCPHYHTSRDRRRKMTTIKYRYFLFLVMLQQQVTTSLVSFCLSLYPSLSLCFVDICMSELLLIILF